MQSTTRALLLSCQVQLACREVARVHEDYGDHLLFLFLSCELSQVSVKTLERLYRTTACETYKIVAERPGFCPSFAINQCLLVRPFFSGVVPTVSPGEREATSLPW